MELSEPDPDVIANWHANLTAGRLRARGVSYGAIAIVMKEFTGIARTEEQWRYQLRKQGSPGAARGEGIASLRRKVA